MRVIHIADPHLGYRAYNRVNAAGLNAREADVFDAFRQAVSRTVEADPDLILIAGDLFHVVRPSNLTIQHTFREFASLRMRTQAPVVIIGGNHDSPDVTHAPDSYRYALQEGLYAFYADLVTQCIVLDVKEAPAEK